MDESGLLVLAILWRKRETKMVVNRLTRVKKREADKVPLLCGLGQRVAWKVDCVGLERSHWLGGELHYSIGILAGFFCLPRWIFSRFAGSSRSRNSGEIYDIAVPRQ